MPFWDLRFLMLTLSTLSVEHSFRSSSRRIAKWWRPRARRREGASWASPPPT